MSHASIAWRGSRTVDHSKRRCPAGHLIEPFRRECPDDLCSARRAVSFGQAWDAPPFPRAYQANSAGVEKRHKQKIRGFAMAKTLGNFHLALLIGLVLLAAAMFGLHGEVIGTKA